MACTRGCTGTPICSALDLCCLQLRHDCGKECGGLASGYSTIQINDVGELEVCSNVGGICTCTAVAVGTDQLVNNGDGTLTHTAVDTDAVTFCNGIDTILAVNDCDEGGIGTDYMVREVTLLPVADACTQLRIEGAPEHTSLCSAVDEPDFVVLPTNPPVGLTLDLLHTELVVNNISPCRDMACVINYTSGMFFVEHNGIGAPPYIGRDTAEMRPVFTVNGGGVFNPAARNMGVWLDMPGNSFNSDHAGQGWAGCAQLAPGENLTIVSAYDVEVYTTSTITTIIVQGGSISVFGSTI